MVLNLFCEKTLVHELEKHERAKHCTERAKHCKHCTERTRMADKDKALAGPPLPDEPAYGTLPPKALEKLFGVDTIVRNPDDPTDGVFEVIKDKKGVVLCIRNPLRQRDSTSSCR